jgi:hypothetical protein
LKSDGHSSTRLIAFKPKKVKTTKLDRKEKLRRNIKNSKSETKSNPKSAQANEEVNNNHV